MSNAVRSRPIRRTRRWRALGLGVSLTCLAGLPLTALQSPAEFDELHAMFSAFRLDSDATGEVRGVTLTRESGEIELTDGTIALLRPFRGNRVGAVYVGPGRFRMTAPIAVERGQLARFFGSETIDHTFSGAFMLFTDETLQELEAAGVTFDGGARLAPHERLIDAADEYLVGNDTKDPDRELMSALLHGGRSGHSVFYAHLAPGGDRSSGRALFYQVARRMEEPIAFGRAVNRNTYELITSFKPAQAYLGDPTARAPRSVGVQVDHYTVDFTIRSGLDVEVEAELSIRALEPGGFWNPFSLTTSLRVDSARWSSGEPADFRRGRDGFALWLRVPETLQPGDSAAVKFWYRGSDLLEETRDWYYLTSSTYWYPRNGGERSTFDLTFHTPKDRELVSIGSNVQDTVVGNVRTTRWVTTDPFGHASFNYGEMASSVLVDPRIPPVAMTINEQAHRTIGVQRARATGLPETDLALVRRELEGDVANAISFFMTWFGDPPITELRVTEIPFNHGQAFPGMIHLSWITFEGMGTKGYDEMFRAHEVAHQWWGLGVKNLTYRDTWLSEGFSEFAGLWFLNTVLEEPERYLDRLRDTKREILSRRDKAPPIGLGTRVASRDNPRDYQTIVYDKGAWVLHMLRNIFMDLQTLDESRFVGMLRDFYLAFAGSEATTEDFRRAVEVHLGADMGWFFDQWLYGSAIPTYRVEYCGKELEDGRWAVTARVEQERVPEAFQMYVPLRLDFGNEGSARLRIGVRGPLTEVALPPMPRRPSRIVFNEFESVLAEVDDNGWRCR